MIRVVIFSACIVLANSLFSLHLFFFRYASFSFVAVLVFYGCSGCLRLFWLFVAPLSVGSQQFRPHTPVNTGFNHQVSRPG